MKISQEFIDDVVLAFKRCNEQFAELKVKKEQIKELQAKNEKLKESIEYAMGCGIMTETVCKKFEQVIKQEPR